MITVVWNGGNQGIRVFNVPIRGVLLGILRGRFGQIGNDNDTLFVKFRGRIKSITRSYVISVH